MTIRGSIKIFTTVLLGASVAVAAPFGLAAERTAETAPPALLQAYRAELNQFHQDFGGSRDLPDERFFLFGMGLRTKLLYKSGALRNASSGEVIGQWDVGEEIILPAAYSVNLRLSGGGAARIVEDEGGVWMFGDRVTRSIRPAGRRSGHAGARMLPERGFIPTAKPV